MTRSRWIVAPVIAAAALLVVAACGSDADTGSATVAPGFPMTVSDCGRPLTLPDRPRRILTMSSTSSTLMWAAGAADKITTRSYESVADLGPAQQALVNVPLVSNNNDLSLETILGLRPDLVITAGLNLTTPQDLAAAGVASIVPKSFCDGNGSGPADGPVTFENDVFPDIELYGRIAGTEQAATAKVAELRRRLAAINAAPPNPNVRTAAVIGLDGTSIRAYGTPSLTHDQLGVLGLTDVFEDIQQRIGDVSAEELITRDPDVVILLVGGGGGGVGPRALENLRGNPALAGVTAIRENRIIPLESPYLLGGPLAVDGVEKMAQAIAGYR